MTMRLNFVPKALSNRLTLNNLLLLTGNATVQPGSNVLIVDRPHVKAHVMLHCIQYLDKKF
jgi:hypothetical protein